MLPVPDLNRIIETALWAQPVDRVIRQAGHTWDINDPTGDATKRSVEGTFILLNAHF
jgi:hypothetical protein